MQGLSSRAHAFSVEALVGKKPCKIRKVSGGLDVSLAAEARIAPFTGEEQLYPHKTNKTQKNQSPFISLFFSRDQNSFNRFLIKEQPGRMT